jgi:hypothetical protein
MGAVRFTDWIQIAGLFAVFGSLVFVGMQMCQTHEIASATLYQMRSDGSKVSMCAMIVPSPIPPTSCTATA